MAIGQQGLDFDKWGQCHYEQHRAQCHDIDPQFDM
jgi:hypothetical protein